MPARRDKYEGTAEYWVDVETTGSLERENEESIVESTMVEGQGSTFSLGLDPIAEPAEGGADDSGSNNEDEDDAMTSVSKRNSMAPATESALEAWSSRNKSIEAYMFLIHEGSISSIAVLSHDIVPFESQSFQNFPHSRPSLAPCNDHSGSGQSWPGDVQLAQNADQAWWA